MPRAARGKREAIYSNGISYHLFPSLGCYVQKPVWEEGGGDRVGESRLFPQQAACQRAGEASLCARARVCVCVGVCACMRVAYLSEI